jgi:hypothetical protein
VWLSLPDTLQKPGKGLLYTGATEAHLVPLVGGSGGDKETVDHLLALAESLDPPPDDGRDAGPHDVLDGVTAVRLVRVDNGITASWPTPSGLYLHAAAAMNLLARLRRFIAEPLPAPAPQSETVSPTCQLGQAADPADETDVPAEALTGGRSGSVTFRGGSAAR